jgi:hypothetical protein
MPDFVAAIAAHKDLPEDEQKRMGQAAGNDMEETHKMFLQKLIAQLDKKDIDITNTETLVDQAKYAALALDARAKVDLSLLNIADQIRRIEWFYRSATTPNASPELQTMIDHLWDMKSRAESKAGTIFRF